MTVFQRIYINFKILKGGNIFNREAKNRLNINPRFVEDPGRCPGSSTNRGFMLSEMHEFLEALKSAL